MGTARLALRRRWASFGVSCLVCIALALAAPVRAQDAPPPAEAPEQPPEQTPEQTPQQPGEPPPAAPPAEPAPEAPVEPPAEPPAQPTPETPPEPTDPNQPAEPTAPTQPTPQTPTEQPAPTEPQADDAAQQPAGANDSDAATPAQPAVPPPAAEPPTDTAAATDDPQAMDPFAASQAASTEDAAAEEAGWGEEEEGWGGEGDGAGFGEAGAADPAVTAEPESIPGELSVGGFLRHMVALWTERMEEQPLSRVRQSADFSMRYKKPFPTSDGRITLRAVADVHFEYDFAYLADRDLYDEATLDTYEYQVIGGETFLSLSLGNLDVTFGRQIVAWGHGEMLSPVDIVNPRDQRDPAIAELDDIRMAVLASRVGLFFEQQRLELMVIHESYFGLRAAPLSDLSPLRGMILDDPSVGMLLQGQELRYDDEPDRFDSQGSQVLGRWTYAGPGIDLALYAASTLDKQGVAIPRFDENGIAIEMWHPRYTMLGHAGAHPSGDFIYRWELALDLERPISVTGGDDSMAATSPGAPPSDGLFTPPEFRNQLNWMLGTSYGGITDGTLSIEYGQSFIFDNPERDGSDRELLFSPEQPAMAARYTHMFLRERLQATVVGTLFGLTSFRGAMGKLDLSYVVADGWKIGAGYAAFLPAEDEFGPFYGFDTHDRVYGTLRWDFLLE